MFDFGKNVFLGIDIGTSSIKIAEIKVSGGKPCLSNYGWMSLDDLGGKYDFGSAYFETTLPVYLKRMIREAGFKVKNVYLSIPAFGGLITLIDFPKMAPKDMEEAIKFEAHKYIPTSFEELVLSWDIVGEKSGQNFSRINGAGAVSQGGAVGHEVSGSEMSDTKVQVLLVAASKNQVAKYEKMAKKVGLTLRSLEIESFSMVTSLVGNDPGNFIILDIGARICNLILVEKGIIRANRNIDAGGVNFTGMIAKSMGINEERAEKLKISGKNFFENDSYINFPVLELITAEVSRMINAAGKNEESFRIDAIILSGGTANLAGLTDYFFKTLGVKTIVGNPFSRISYERKLEPAISKIKTRFSVCAGLALKGANNYLKNK